MKEKVAIIGGGVAGLSAGIYSAMNGFDTVILEMHSVAGGQCTAWDRQGYRFDYCLHWLVGTSKGAFHDIWKETNVLNDRTEIIDQAVKLVGIGVPLNRVLQEIAPRFLPPDGTGYAWGDVAWMPATMVPVDGQAAAPAPAAPPRG